MTRIVINPDSLRSTARGLNEAASEYGLYARAVRGEDLYSLAPDIRGTVAGVIQNAGRELTAISSELGREADILRTRATRVEESGAALSALTAAMLLFPAGQLVGRGSLQKWLRNEVLKWAPGKGAGLKEWWGWTTGWGGVFNFISDARARKTLRWTYRYDLRRIGKEFTGRDMALIRRTARVGLAGMLGGAVDGASFGVDFASGRYDKLGLDSLKVGDDLLSVAAKRFGLYSAAFQAGMFIGFQIDKRYRVGEKSASAIETDAIASQYSGETADELTPAQASDYAHRYDGISGFGNFAKDGVGTVAHGFSNGAQSARTFFNRVF